MSGLVSGLDAYNRGDYATALREWLPLAVQGNAPAQHSLGLMYGNGRGVPQDYTEAMKWYRLAAEQGDAGAQHALGVMYYFGNGVPQDYAEAMKWFRLAADQGTASAQYILGLMYRDGRGVPQDYVKAHVWWHLAVYQIADDIIANRDEVRGLLNHADICEKAIGNLNIVAGLMTPSQIEEAQRLGWQASQDSRREWLAAHP
jgi:TPR repeat protein